MSTRENIRLIARAPFVNKYIYTGVWKAKVHTCTIRNSVYPDQLASKAS